MDDGVKSIDQQLDGCGCRGTFATGIVEGRRHARMMRHWMWRQAMHAPGPPIVATYLQVQAHYWLTFSLYGAVRQNEDEPKRQHPDGDQYQLEERFTDFDGAR